MTARDVSNPHRCTHRERQGDGTETECSDVGGWKLDKARKTWVPTEPGDKSRRCWAHGPGAVVKPNGPRPGKPKPNARVQRSASLLLGVAPEVTRALQEASAELSLLGFPSSSTRGTRIDDDAADPVGDDVTRIVQLTTWREDLRDAIHELERRVDWIIKLVNDVRNVRWAHGAKLCADNQQGQHGSIEWGDPTCTELPVRKGLCERCSKASRRWLESRGLPTDHEPAA